AVALAPGLCGCVQEICGGWLGRTLSLPRPVLKGRGWDGGNSRERLQRLLLVSAILASELDPGLAFFRLDPIRRAALAADGLDAGRALLDDDGLLFHRFADQALGLLTQRLFRQ